MLHFRFRFVPRWTLTLAVLWGVGLAPRQEWRNVAWAHDLRPVEIPLGDGRVLKGVVVALDQDIVSLRHPDGSIQRIPRAELSALGTFRVRQALAPAADGAARRDLAELAAALGLRAEARAELEKALALGALSERDFAQALSRLEEAAVREGVEHARHAAESGRMEEALKVARTLQSEFSAAPNAKAISALIRDLLQTLHALQSEERAMRQLLARLQAEAPRQKEVVTRRIRALDRLAAAKRRLPELADLQKKGNVSRSRRIAEAADADLMRARRELGRLRRVLGPTDPSRTEILALLDRLDEVQFDLRFEMAYFLFHGAGVITEAERWAARASYIDPVHPDLLELRRIILASRIRYRASDVTNARGPIIR